MIAQESSTLSKAGTPSGLGARLRPMLESGWAWMVIACVLLTTTGLIRNDQDRQIGRDRSAIDPCPFPLNRLPENLGDWTIREGSEFQLDDQTVRITGSTEHLIRTYTDNFTGVQLSVLILYGPAEPVLPHTPEVCFPATGFRLESEIGQSDVAYNEDKEARFRTASYFRSRGRVGDQVRVYYSFRLDGVWAPDIGAGKRFNRSNPGIFKVQIQRPMMVGEQIARDEPIEKFLALLLPEIERRIAQGEAGPIEAASR